MLSIQEFIQNYYKKNSEILERNYPGIKLQRLVDEFCLYYKLNSNEIYSQIYEEFFKLLETGRPLEYIQRNSYFYKANFYVDERVLIPRNETEILVEDAISYIKKNYNQGFHIAEVGTGSFVIGLTVAMEVEKPINLVGGDISSGALVVSQTNLFRHEYRIPSNSNLRLVNSDRLKNIDGHFDLIISNPPYIKRNEDLVGVHAQTFKYEPHQALFLDDDIFDKWFDDFFKDASNKLFKNHGAFMMEGHEDSLLQLQEIAMKYFKKVEIKRDYTGSLRFLYAYMKE